MTKTETTTTTPARLAAITETELKTLNTLTASTQNWLTCTGISLGRTSHDRRILDRAHHHAREATKIILDWRSAGQAPTKIVDRDKLSDLSGRLSTAADDLRQSELSSAAGQDTRQFFTDLAERLALEGMRLANRTMSGATSACLTF